jgi:hypothetical protein
MDTSANKAIARRYFSEMVAKALPHSRPKSYLIKCT